MIFREIYDTLTNLINTDINYEDLLKTYKDENQKQLMRILASNSLNLGVKSLINIVRITKVESKRCHCIICEMSDECIKQIEEILDPEDDGNILWTSSIFLNDDDYTVIYTERLDNKSRIGLGLISNIVYIMTNELKCYVRNNRPEVATSNDIMNVVLYTQYYMPIGICRDTNIRVVTNDKSNIEFIAYINNFYKDDKLSNWVDDLFEDQGLFTIVEKGYEDILFLEDRDEDDE